MPLLEKTGIIIYVVTAILMKYNAIWVSLEGKLREILG